MTKLEGRERVSTSSNVAVPANVHVPANGLSPLGFPVAGGPPGAERERRLALRRNRARRRMRKTVSMVRPQAPRTRAASHKGFEFSLAGGRGTTSDLCGMAGRVILGRN